MHEVITITNNEHVVSYSFVYSSNITKYLVSLVNAMLNAGFMKVLSMKLQIYENTWCTQMESIVYCRCF